MEIPKYFTFASSPSQNVPFPACCFGCIAGEVSVIRGKLALCAKASFTLFLCQKYNILINYLCPHVRIID